MTVALIGLGAMGSTHYNLLKKMDDIEIIALVDTEETRTREKSAECGARTYLDINEMLSKEKPDFVDICTPSYLHYQHSITAMNKGIHVLVEKPIALKTKDAIEIVKCSEENNVYFMVAHVLRFWPEYEWLKKVTDSKQYGKLHHLNAWRCGVRPLSSWNNWMLNKEKSGLVPYDLLIHDIDFMVYLLGSPENMDVYDINDSSGHFVETHWHYNNGTRALAKASWYNGRVPFNMGYEAIFEGGYAEYRNDNLIFYPNDEQAIAPIKDNCQLADSEINVANTNGFYKELRYFINCIDNKTKPSIIRGDELITVISILSDMDNLLTGEA